MLTYICTLEGISPMLMHRFGDAEETEQTARRIHIKAEDPRDVAERSAYRTETGALYLPGAAIARLLREAGAAHKQRGSRKSLKYVVPAAVLVPTEQIILVDGNGDPLTDYEVDSRPVVIPSTKGRIMRHRPRLNQWGCEFHLEVDDDQLEPTLVHQLLTEGGRKIGILDFRPEKGGTFGRYHVISWGVLGARSPEYRRREPMAVAAE